MRGCYSIKEFIESDLVTWGKALVEHHQICMGEPPSRSQKEAWIDCYNVLKAELSSLNLSVDLKESIYILFEYELPRERGRRPDVIILAGNVVLVLEFKGHSRESQAHIDQVSNYARDLKHYHSASHDLSVIPFLVLVSAKGVNKTIDDVRIVSSDRLISSLQGYILAPFKDIRSWYDSEYAPLPSIIQSAQASFWERLGGSPIQIW